MRIAANLHPTNGAYTSKVSVNPSEKNSTLPISNFIKRIFDYKILNSVYTFLLLAVFGYFFFTAFFKRNPFSPIHQETTLNGTISHLAVDSSSNIINSIILLFISLIVALALGRICSILYLPHLLGYMIVGVIIKNVAIFEELFILPTNWSANLRAMAFITILIRNATGLDFNALKKYYCLSLSIGLISVLFEAMCVATICFYVFNVPILLSVLFGFLITPNSPAIIVPSMIELIENNLSVKNGLPTIILTAASIDNIFAIFSIYFMISLVFNDVGNENIFWKLLLPVIEVVIGIFGGTILGYLLALIPNKESKLFHFTRLMLLISLTFGVYFNAQLIGFNGGAVVLILVFGVIVSLNWKADNTDQMKYENNALKHMWKLCLEPILFILLATSLSLDKLSLLEVLSSLLIITVATVGRFVIVYLILLTSHFNYLEKLFVSCAFLPKATVQAALIPLVYQLTLTSNALKEHAHFILTTCICAVLLTAPLGSILLKLLPKICLKKDVARVIEVEPEITRNPIIISDPIVGHFPTHQVYVPPMNFYNTGYYTTGF
uniref:Na_H_Exchanger domain-containing protein n=1 Tax=Rhabditophanes sp. KR3021 TaxID=114890 RepID=A0AC35TTF9_9BILA